jgi:NAD(P)-dependent dehydrogenase (short-subunit alcohol dehydrogenase family)
VGLVIGRRGWPQRLRRPIQATAAKEETPMRILFTGGSGKAGKHVVPYLLEQGHRVVNVDLTPLDHPGVDNLTADITDSGQMFNVMLNHSCIQCFLVYNLL